MSRAEAIEPLESRSPSRQLSPDLLHFEPLSKTSGRGPCVSYSTREWPKWFVPDTKLLLVGVLSIS